MKQKLSDMQQAGNVSSNYTNVLGLILVRPLFPVACQDLTDSPSRSECARPAPTPLSPT